MPSWKNREAGRRGHERFEMPDKRRQRQRDDFDFGRPDRISRAELDRVERLTRTATALGPGPGDDEHELEAVADELDRLLVSREQGTSKRSARRGSRKEDETSRSRKPASRRSKSAGRFENDHLNEMIDALERLDRKVQDYTDPGDYADDYDDPRGLAPEEYRDDPYRDEMYDEVPRGPVRRRPADYRDDDPSLGLYRDIGRRIDALRQPQEEAYDRVREEIGSLRDELGGHSRGSRENTGRQNAELRRLSDMVERLRVDRRDDTLAKDVRKEISDLKSMMARANVEGSLQTLERGYAHIVQRLDELSRATVDPRAVRSLVARVDEIEQAFSTLPRSEHLVVLQDRIGEISDRVEELLLRKNHADIEPLRNELKYVREFVEQIDVKGLVEGIDDRMSFVSSRLDDLEQLAREQQGLDMRLSAMEERMPAPETLSRLQGRLEEIVGMISDDRAYGDSGADLGRVDSRLDDIVGRLERMEQTGPALGDSGSFSVLEQRLDAIANKIESLEGRTGSSGSGLPGADLHGEGVDDKLLTQLQARLNVLSEQLEAPRDTVTTADLDKLRDEIGSMRASIAAPASTEVLESRINELAQAIERGGEGLDDSRFEQLGSKVTALAEQLETASGGGDGMSSVAGALARIEQGLQETRRDVVEIAQKAAREAVVGKPEGGNAAGYDDTIQELQGDLKRLLDAAEGSEERTRNTFEGVQSVLGSLTERLENLEKTGSPLSGKKAGSFLSKSPIGSAGPVPGAYGGEDPSETRPAHRVRDRKADFIAAARRAAQAASAEVAQMEAEEERSSARTSRLDEDGQGRSGWLRNVLKRGKKPDDDIEDLIASEQTVASEDDWRQDDPANVMPDDRPAPDEPQPSGGGGRRKALLFAAAAVVLAIGTLQIFKMATSTSPEGDQVAMTSQDAVTKPLAANKSDASRSVDAPAKGVVQAASGAKVKPASQATPVKAGPVAMAKDQTKTETVDRTAANAVSGAKVAVAKPGKIESAPAMDKTASADPAKPAKAAREAPSELAFAPPEKGARPFGADGTIPGAGLDKSKDAANAATVSAALVTTLPPEEIGPMALRRAAASGNAAAEFLVGVKYTEGSGVAANLAEAAKWYQKAAAKGLAPAQYRLASLYEKGNGVERDATKARDWYVKAAEAGNIKAMHNLAVLYAEGQSGSPDFKEAAKWFEKAASYGVKDSLFNLGILYARGLGVEKNLVQSYKWFAIGAKQGDQDAAKKRDDVANSMDQAKLAEAQLEVEKFKLQKPNTEANKVIADPAWAAADTNATNASVVGDHIAMVRKAQVQLNMLGFDTGTPDGQMGPRTRSAVKAFQRSLGLSETGEIDANLMKELDSQAI